LHRFSQRIPLRPIRMQNTPLLLKPGRSLFRHAAMGLLQAFLVIPISLAILVGLSPMSYLMFCAVLASYVAFNTLCILPVATVAFCLHDNVCHARRLLARKSLPIQLIRCVHC
jgi:hypothetical protein